MGKERKLGVRDSRTQSKKNEDHISIAKSLLIQKNDQFPKNIILGDEKLFFYSNVQRKRQWITENESLLLIPKTELHGRKVM